MIDESTEVSASELKLILEVEKSQLADYVKKGIVERSGYGKYKLVESVRRHREWMKDGGRISSPITTESGEVIDFNEQRARKTKLEADALELKNAQEVGKYRDISEVTAEIQDAARITATVLNNLKLNIARLAPELPNRALDAIEKESAKALMAICELDESYKQIEAEVSDSVEIRA